MKKKGQITSWSVLIFLIVFLFFTDSVFFLYSQNVKQMQLNSSIDSSSTSEINENTSVIKTLGSVHASAPSDVPTWLITFIAVMNFLVLIVIYMLIRGMW